jgi:WD40 repeat protein
MNHHYLIRLLASTTVLAGCASEMSLARGDKASAEADTGYWNESDADTDADADWDEGAPETEDDFLALMPAQTDIYVFIANPNRDTVTRVNVLTQAVDTTEVGQEPDIVLTTKDYSTAVVFNKGDDSVTILDALSLAQSTVDVRENFNNMTMSPDATGSWVALWHDIAAEDEDDEPAAGLQSYNEASFVNTLTGEHFPMAVGFNPRAIKFTPDASVAVVVSDEYLALVDLTAQTPTPTLIQVSDDLVDPPAAEEVVLAPDGSYAFVRQFGTTELVVVDLLDLTVDYLPVGANPTDLDLSPDGTTATLVARGDEELWIFDVNQPFATPEVLALPEGSALGSLAFSPTGEQAIIYTTASNTDRYASWDISSGEIELRSMVKPVSGIAITPTGETMLAFHTKSDITNADTTSPFYNNWALTMIDLSDFRSNPLKLPAKVDGYANSTNGSTGYFIMKGEPYLEVLDYQTLLYDEIKLKSDPVFLGVLPDLDETDNDEPPAWVSQEHELGRITFYDSDDDSIETITGFELNSEIED